MKKIKLSLFDILARLAKEAPRNIDVPSSENDKRVTQSVRLPTEVRAWVYAQAEHLGVSVQDFICLTLKGVMMSTDSPQTDELDTMLMRFFQLFECHNIATADITKFLPVDSISRSELRDSNKVIDLIDDRTTEHLQNIFHVKKNWLKGTSDYAYEERRFYKNLPEILSVIARHKLKMGNGVEVIFLTREGVYLNELSKIKAGENLGNGFEYVNVFLRLEKEIHGERITTYQSWDSLNWDHWRSRYYAKALIYFCDKTQTNTIAYSLNDDKYDDFVTGRTLISNLSNHGKRWFLDELVWGDERNTEIEELDSIKSFFSKEGGDKYISAIRASYKIKNYEGFLSGKETLEMNDQDELI